jgi:peptide/nickel transport system substrate-binding protein
MVQVVRDGGSEVNRRRAIWGIGVLLLVAVLVLAMAGCGGTEETTTTASVTATTAPVTTAPPVTETTVGETTTTALQPVAGGVLRDIVSAGPQDVGWWANMGPTEEAMVFPGVERLMKFAPGRQLVPCLAKTVTEDPDALTITFELNQGVKFHDGTELTSAVAKWNYDVAGAKLQFADAIKEFEIVDDYNFVLHLNYWHNQLLQAIGWVPMFSQAAYEANGGATGGMEWCVDNCVGTGPFTLAEYNRDQSLKWLKNPNYWGGEVLLDEIDVSIIPDAATASSMILAGQADVWASADAQGQSEMEAAGLTLQSGWAGFQYHLMPNTVDAASPCNKLQVREALEYALDKQAICDAIGYGRFTPLYAVAPEGEWGADSIPVKRDYDPEKAKALLVEAGYPDGCPIDLLAVAETGGRSTGAEAIKGYLDAAGFITNLDIADAGRFYGAVFGTGWKDVALMFSGNDVNYLMSCAAWWSPTPKTNLASFKRPAEFSALFEPAMMARTPEEQEAKTGEIVGMMNQEALMIPVYNSPNTLVIQPYVHTDYPMEAGFVGWSWEKTWMEAH